MKVCDDHQQRYLDDGVCAHCYMEAASMAKQPEPELTQFTVRYRFADTRFSVVISATDAEDAKVRARAAFERDAYPMDRIEILSALPYALAGSA